MKTDIRDLVSAEDLFDPLADEEKDELDEEPLVGAPIEENPASDDPDFRPARVRIEDLLKSMPGHRRTLLRIIDFCREEKTGAEMDARIEELLKFNFSVFSPVIFRELLEKAGAIQYLPSEEELTAQETGNTVQSESFFDGEEEVELEYLEVEEVAPGTWLATEDGLAIVDEQDDYARMKELLGKEPQYESVYRLIIEDCDVEGGRSAKTLDDLVNDLEILQEPRRYSGYFVGRLEREGAIEWVGGWKTTEVGRAILAELSA